MADVISAISSIVTGAIDWIGDYVGVITSNPLLLAFVVVSFVGLGVGLLRRLIRV